MDTEEKTNQGVGKVIRSDLFMIYCKKSYNAHNLYFLTYSDNDVFKSQRTTWNQTPSTRHENTF